MIASFEDAQKAAELFDSVIAPASLWAKRIETASVPLGTVAGTVLNGEKSGALLLEIRSNMILRAKPLIDSFSSARWLWHLRSVDTLLIDSRPHGEEVPLFRIAENLTAGSMKAPDLDLPEDNEALSYPWDLASASKVARLIALARTINLSEGWVRRAGKNTEFIARDSGLPVPVWNEVLHDAIEEYDERAEADGVDRWHPLMVQHSDEAIQTDDLLAAYKLFDGWHQVDQWSGPLIEARIEKDEGQYVLRTFSLGEGSNPQLVQNSMEALSNPTRVAAIVVTASAIHHHVVAVSKRAGKTLPRSGYVEMTVPELNDSIEWAMERARNHAWPLIERHVPRDAGSVVDEINAAYSFGERHAAGPVFRPTSNGWLVDVSAITWHIVYDLNLNASYGGELVNLAATDFELAVQALLNEKASVASSLRDLRGRNLELHGRVITDLDALFTLDGVLFLVSCKQFSKPRQYDMGDFSAVRNAEGRVNDAVLEWKSRVGVIRSNPIGSNYDFSGFRVIEGIVISPELMFTTSFEAREQVLLGRSGIAIHWYGSFAELRDGLDAARRVGRR